MTLRLALKIVVILFVTLSLWGQKEANIWYFGSNAGVDFNSGSPVALTDGALNTFEGVATICDQYGNLLFYTDGISVWNKNHSVMPNGTGLMGHMSSSQSAVIVPQPGAVNIYYIFTVTDLGRIDGLRYSTVDMTLQSGLGDVTTKNILLRTPVCEKITAVRHSNNSDVWVVAHDWGNNNFISYLVTSTGVNTTAVVSSSGITHSGDIWNTIGYLKSSPQGDKLACVMYKITSIQLVDFDNSNGTVSNPLALTDALYYGLYGIEFSPDGTKLYAGKHAAPANIFQFDLTASDINGSRVNLHDGFSGSYGALQLGPDSKIYASPYNQPHLGVIDKPDLAGTSCNFSANAVSLNARTCYLGLPTFIQSYFDFKLVLSSNSPVCEGETIYLYCDTVPNATYTWTGPAGFYSQDQNPVRVNATIPMTGYYYCTVTLPNRRTETDSIYVIVNPKPTIDAGDNVSICTGDGIQIGNNASGGSSPYDYTWRPATGLSSNKASQPVATPDTTTKYIVQVTDANGCIATDSIIVTTLPNPIADAGPDLSICLGESIPLDVTVSSGYSPYDFDWSPDQSLSASDTQSPIAAPDVTTQYIVTVTDANGCTAIDSVTVVVNPLPIADAGRDTIICATNSVMIGGPASGGTGPYSYSWNDTTWLSDPDINNPMAFPDDTTEFIVTVTDANGCADTDTVVVYTLPGPVVDAGENISLCLGDTIMIGNPASSGTAPFTYRWSPSSGLEDIQSVPARAYPDQTTTYYLYVTDGSGCSSQDSITVTVNPNPVADAGQDIENCYGLGANIGNPARGGTPPYSYKWTPASGLNTDDEAVVFANPESDTRYIVEVIDANGCSDRDTMDYIVHPLPQAILSLDGPASFCNCDDGVNIDAGGDYLSYKWSNSATTRSIYVDSSGTYYVTVIDSNGCVNNSDTVTITVYHAESTIGLNETGESASPGDHVFIPLRIVDSQFLDSCHANSFTALISYNRALLVPSGNTPFGSLTSERRRLEINGTRQASDTLFLMEFIATLGDTSYTDLTIEAFTWNDCVFPVDTINSGFSLTGLCEEGGATRYFRKGTGNTYLTISPNPARNDINISYFLTSNSHVEISLIDLAGRNLRKQIFPGQGKGRHEFSIHTSGLASGSYILILKTESNTSTKILEIEK